MPFYQAEPGTSPDGGGERAAASALALLRQIDALAPSLDRAEGAFARLFRTLGDGLARMESLIERFENQRVDTGPAADGVQRAGADAAADLLETQQARLDTERQINLALADQEQLASAAAEAQGGAAAKSRQAWRGFEDDLLAGFDRTFDRATEGGAIAFESLWQRIGDDLLRSFSRLDWRSALVPLARTVGALVAGGPGAGGGGGSLSAAAGSGLSIFSRLPISGLGGLSPLGAAGIGAIASLVGVGISKLFEDEDHPFAKAVIGLDRGRAVAESSFELDGGPLDQIERLQESVIASFEDFLGRLGSGFAGSAPNFLQIGYASGRKSTLPKGFFVGGLATTGDFSTGGDVTGIEDGEELTARAIEVGLLKAVREDKVEPFADNAKLDAAIRQTLSAGLERAIALPFESLETSLRRVEFLATFEETVQLYGDGAAALDDYNIRIRLQRDAIAEAAQGLADEAFAPIATFLADARLLFSGEGASEMDSRRLAAAAEATRGMTADLFADLALTPQEAAPFEGFALLYEEQRAQIAALVPALTELNAELSALGAGTVDIAATVAEATEALQDNVQEQFRRSLTDALDPDAAAARKATEERDSLLRQAEQLGFGADKRTRLQIEALYRQDLERVGYTLNEAGEAVSSFAAEIAKAADAVAAQAAAQERLVADARRLVDSLAEARRAIRLDADLSPLSPLQRLDAARSEFERLSAAAAAGDEDAKLGLGASGRSYLELARQIHASSAAYAEIFEQVDRTLAATLAEAEDHLATAERQLGVLEEIRDRLAPRDGALDRVAYRQSSGGQFVAAGDGVVAAGYDLGHNPETALAILVALKAAGLPLPGGFGEGQLTRLRAENPAVEAVVGALGFADGGIMGPSGPVTLRRYAAGGIAAAPELALFGEGSQPEAYVPLADGRTIPVSLSLPANDDARTEQREAVRRQAADNQEMLREARRLRAELAALRTDNERLNRVLTRALARQSA